MGRYNAALGSEMRSAALGLDRWASLLETDPAWAGATVGQEQLDALQSIGERVRMAGFDDDEREGFAAAGFSDETIDALKADIGIDGYDAVQVDVPVEQLLRDAAAELREQATAFDDLASEADAVAQTTDTPPARELRRDAGERRAAAAGHLPRHVRAPRRRAADGHLGLRRRQPDRRGRAGRPHVQRRHVRRHSDRLRRLSRPRPRRAPSSRRRPTAPLRPGSVPRRGRAMRR